MACGMVRYTTACHYYCLSLLLPAITTATGVIVGARNAGHVGDHAAVFNVKLDAEDRAAVDDAVRQGGGAGPRRMTLMMRGSEGGPGHDARCLGSGGEGSLTPEVEGEGRGTGGSSLNKMVTLSVPSYDTIIIS